MQGDFKLHSGKCSVGACVGREEQTPARSWAPAPIKPRRRALLRLGVPVPGLIYVLPKGVSALPALWHRAHTAPPEAVLKLVSSGAL